MRKELLKIVADNPALLEELKTLFESKFTVDVSSDTLTDEHLGQVIRARVTGLNKLKLAFTEIEQCATVKAKPERSNPAR